MTDTLENIVMPEKCKVCGEDPTKRGFGGMYKHNQHDIKLAKEYCGRTANSNQIVKPVWKECCGALQYYKVTLKDNKKPLWEQKLKS
jgi:hypothetical protein